MNLHQLAELAGLVASRARQLVASSRPLPAQFLYEFWNHSKQRHNVWRGKLNASDDPPAASWKATGQEILVSELLTRVWAATLSAADQHRGTRQGESIGRSALLGHQHARNLALQWVLQQTDQSASPLDRLRRQVERWTDVLLGPLSVSYHLEEFLFEPQRAHDFGEDFLQERAGHADSRFWTMTLAGLHKALRTPETVGTEVSEESRRVVGAILATFPAEMFSADGSFRSLGEIRLFRDAGQGDLCPPRDGLHQKLWQWAEMARNRQASGELADRTDGPL